MKEISILIGGKAGDGIKQAGNFIARLFDQLGYWIFIYEDYPSLITGGHNFSIIRASSERILAHKDKIDLVIAFNEDAIKKHQNRFHKDTILIYDSSVFKYKGDGPSSKLSYGIPISKIAIDNNLPLIVRNSIVLGILAGIVDLELKILEKIIRSSLDKKVEENIKVAKIAYQQAKHVNLKTKIQSLNNPSKKLLTGNETTALGAIAGGMEMYIAYPMTPASSILHYLAAHQDKLKIKSIQIENEIGVVLMAEGAAYAGKKTMTGTSGGGFALMVEAVSLAGQAEIPIVFVMSQRPGPATGMPTYTLQGDMLFTIFAGHGEFPKIVLAPGDADEAYYLAAESINLAWKYQTPVILLLDKHLSESTFSTNFDPKKIKKEKIKIWNNKGKYQRYQQTADGISPLAFPGNKNAIVKAVSYEHDEFGISTEIPELIIKMVDKRARKKETIIKDLKFSRGGSAMGGKKETVKVYGNKNSKNILITWGSTIGSVKEVGEKLGMKVVQPLFLEPLPDEKIKKELTGAKKIIDIEVNSTGQLITLLQQHGIKVDKKILKYDGRPFTVDELEIKIKKALR